MSLAIISGERRGAKLKTPEGLDTRPLRGRVRESLFSILRPRLAGVAVLDAFAGSGAVGLEALSNGAAHCVFIEPTGGALAALNDNIRKLRYEGRTLVERGKSPKILGRLPQSLDPFGMLFLMPPYNSGLCQRVLEDSALNARCEQDCLAVCEIHAEEAWDPPAGWRQVDDRGYGVTRLVFVERVVE